MPDDRYLHLIRKDCPLPAGTHVVGYCRDSGGEEQDRSVRQQEDAIRAYCSEHGLVLEKIYADESRSGGSSERRGGLWDMMHDLFDRFPQVRDLEKRRTQMERRPFGVITWKSHRLGRDSIEATLNKADIRVRGITLIPLLASIETGDQAVNAVFEMMIQLQDERRLGEISEDAKRGLADLVGMRDTDPEFLRHNPDWQPTGAYLSFMPGIAPTGFRRERLMIGVRRRKNGEGMEKRYASRLIPDPLTWDRCYLAWTLRREGHGYKYILNATKLFKSTDGYKHFFENRIYTGDLEYGGQVYENFVPALIPREWWEEEQAQRASRRAKLQGKPVPAALEPRRRASRHLLSGLIFCGEVAGEEHPMYADSAGGRNRWDHYICQRVRHQREKTCPSGTVSARAVEQAVIEGLLREVLTVARLRPIVDAVEAQLDTQRSELDTLIAAVDAKKAEVQRAISKLLDATEAAGFSPAMRDRLKAREDEARDLDAQRAALEQLKSDMEAERTTPDLEEWVTAIRAALTGGNTPLIRQALAAFVVKVVIKNKTATVYCTSPFIDKPRNGEVTPSGYTPIPMFIVVPIRPLARGIPCVNPERAALAARAARLREQGMSYLEIAAALEVSTGAAWGLVNKQKPPRQDERG